MAGMAWTLHPALFYENPFRHLLASLGAGVSLGVGSQRSSAEVDEGSSFGLVFSEGTPVTQDRALSRVDRDVVGTSEKPSTSQCNELAFQRGMYVVRRRQEKQRERLKRMRESRKKPKSSSVVKPRRRSSILAPKLGKKKGKYSQLMTIGTPLAGLQGSDPHLKGVTMVVESASSPGSPVGTESEDDNSEHVSSSDKFIDNTTL
ncbi:hypothetical protein IscW_ISCW003328 [Ixodes scapularis]|uniref:Uncharacterized protein n=1 Tax=Ixodes scapularis TaxID=6945 RepID=B7PCV0_IXOSC|nr:hypothetical protein IscW_ISCW003328 [Ixodes scapularis]|eukprot:XP_002410311.1 hypothetical protein IscW_ISCW003328 [Ixodes scapularis]